MSQLLSIRTSSGRAIALRALTLMIAAQLVVQPALAADWGYDGEFAETNKYGFDRTEKTKKTPSLKPPAALQTEEDVESEPEDPAQQRMNDINDIGDFPKPQIPKKLPDHLKMPKSPPKEAEHLDATTGSLASPDGDVSPAGGSRTEPDEYGAQNNYDENNPAHNIGGKVSVDPDATGSGIAQTDPQWPLISAWLNILGLVGHIDAQGRLPNGPDYSIQLSSTQRNEFSVILKKLLNGPEGAGFSYIGSYWPALSKLMEDVDHRSNYRVLFRALLSMRVDSKDINPEERMMLAEALGPKRIAEPGPPPLTEDAINAYTDMAVFLYEHNHEGKTVDADDNRELYEMIVRDKFQNAPSERDKAAMNDFPLSWAKFRILYTDANESEKLLLATRIASEQGTKGLNIRNAMLEEVLSCPVWKRYVISANVSAKELSNSLKNSSRTASGVKRTGSKRAVSAGGSKTGTAVKPSSVTGANGAPAKKSPATAGVSTVKPKRPL